MQRTTTIILAIAVVSLGFQVFIWEHTTLFDPDFWITRAQYLAHDITHLPVRFNPLRHPGHPAMPPLLIASAFILGGVDAESALRISSIILGTCIIAVSSIFLLTHFKQHRQWVIFIIGMLITNRLLANSNVADAFLMPVILLFFLAIYIIWEQKHRSKYLLLAISLSAGLALATRTHNAVPLLAPAFCLLPIRIGMKKTAILAVGTLVFWYTFTPIIWFTPLQYIRYALIGEPTYVLYTSASIPPSSLVQTSLFDIAVASPLMVIGILLGIAWLYGPKEHDLIPKWYLASLLISTASLLSILQISHIESLRYYYPLIMVWEIFFFPLAMPLMLFIEDRYQLQKYYLVTLCIILSIAGNALMLFTKI